MIAVIAILAAVLIPTFSGLVEKANKSAALQAAQNGLKENYAIDLADGNLDGKDGDTTIAATGYSVVAATDSAPAYATFTASTKGWSVTVSSNGEDPVYTEVNN